MSTTDENTIGKRIVAKVDDLIDVITSISYQKKDGSEELLRRGRSLVKEVSLLLENFLGTGEYYIKQAIQELIKQRLTVTKGLAEGFFDILEEMLASEAPPAAGSTGGEITVAASGDDLERALAYLFSNDEIIRNYRIQGVDLEYYIPSGRLAIINTAEEKSFQARRDYICRNHGIQLIRVDPRKLSGYREIVRYIKRELR